MLVVGVVLYSDNKSGQRMIIIRSKTKTAIFHLRNIAKVSLFLSLDEAETLAQ